MKSWYTIFFLLFSIATLAQDTEQDKLKTREQQRELEKERRIRAELDSGIFYLNREQYDLADVKFRYALNNMKSIPSDLAYFFGKNSYYLRKYKQSVDWLTKYIQLKGTTGQYSSEASSALKKSEEALLLERHSESAKAAQVLSQNYTIDCGPAGKVVCPVCTGSTVIIKKEYLSDVYKTCPYCNKLGYLTCDEYNQLLRGQLKAATENK